MLVQRSSAVVSRQHPVSKSFQCGCRPRKYILKKEEKKKEIKKTKHNKTETPNQTKPKPAEKEYDLLHNSSTSVYGPVKVKDLCVTVCTNRMRNTSSSNNTSSILHLETSKRHLQHACYMPYAWFHNA